MDNPRPFAEQARALCTELQEHHDTVWFCLSCRLLEQRLTPLSMQPEMVALLKEADLTMRVYS